MIRYLEELQSQHLFKALPEKQLENLLSFARLVILGRDEILFNMEDTSTNFYYLRAGQIKIFRSSPQGGEKILSIAQPGQFFAEAVMFLEHSKFPATACALQSSEIISFPNQVFTGYLRSSPDLSMAMLSNLSIKLHNQIVEIDNLTLQNATFRILNYISSLIPDEEPDPIKVELPAPKHTIASRLSITPETFSRSLNELSESQVINTEGKLIGIPNKKRFQNYLISR